MMEEHLEDATGSDRVEATRRRNEKPDEAAGGNQPVAFLLLQRFL
ncbi:MAG: hypothetical protein V4710_03000 [Verrucomicrobiota bacterium]